MLARMSFGDLCRTRCAVRVATRTLAFVTLALCAALMVYAGAAIAARRARG
jgi:hypothetical protein